MAFWDKNEDKPQEKKKTIAQFSHIYQVPLHRSYGKKKRENFFSYLNEFIASALLVIMYTMLLIMLAIGCYVLITLLGTIGQFISIFLVLTLAYRTIFRVHRKRIKFLLKLRRECKKLGFKIEYKRPFFKSFKFNTEGIDLTVDTGKKLWSVRFLPCKKYNCDLIFEDENTIKIKNNPIRLKSSLMGRGRHTRSTRPIKMDTNTPVKQIGKAKTIKYSFTEEITHIRRKSVRALVINPVPHTIRKKEKDGAIYETGTGERMWGYTIFSGSGFIETLKRDSLE